MSDLRPRLLDLFCGAGGCSVGYHRAGFDVVGVDVKPQPNYPFKFLEADALDFIRCLLVGSSSLGFVLTDFAAIHASPPCQVFTSMNLKGTGHKDLLTPCRALLNICQNQFLIPWIIENVPGSPIEIGTAPLFSLDCGIVLCGTMFGLNNGEHELRRHRYFESSGHLSQPACKHRLPVLGFYGDHVRMRQRTVGGHRDRGQADITGNARKMPLVRDLMGIDWMTWDEAKLAIPPAYTEYIGKQLIRVCQREAA